MADGLFGIGSRQQGDGGDGSPGSGGSEGGGIFEQQGGGFGGDGGGGGGQSALVGMGSSSRMTGLTSIRTAADVRARVAAERGDALPEWLISSKSTTTKNPNDNNNQTTNGNTGKIFNAPAAAVKSTHMMAHVGAPPAPVLAMPPFPMG